MESAYSFNPLDIAISGAPPPATTFLSSTVAATTPIASSTALSISSTTCFVEPLTNIVTALGFFASFYKYHVFAGDFLFNYFSSFSKVTER